MEQTITKETNKQFKKVNYHELKNSPFVAVNKDGQYYVIIGDTQVTKTAFKTLKAAQEYVNEKSWELLINTMAIITYKINNYEKENKK